MQHRFWFKPNLSVQKYSFYLKCKEKMIKTGSKNILTLKWIAVVGVLSVVIYPIIISPMINSTPYQDMQKITRKGIDQEKIQPGNMKVWSDPFDRKK